MKHEQREEKELRECVCKATLASIRYNKPEAECCMRLQPMTCDVAVVAGDEDGSRPFPLGPLEQSQRHTTKNYHARKHAQIQARHKHILSAQLLALVAGLSSLLGLSNTAGLKLVIYIRVLRQYTFPFQEKSVTDQVLKSFSFVLAHTPPSSPLPS